MPNTFSVGDLRVTVVSDGAISFPPHLYFPATTPESWAPHERWLDHEGRYAMQFACFLVESAGKRVLIDTGLGSLNMFGVKGGTLLDELASAGFQPENIDTVFVTHLHIDHCGACVTAGDAPGPVFPNATYRWTSVEQAHWLSDAAGQAGGDFSHQAMIDALGDRIENADDGDSLAAGIDVISLPGHTPGHAGVVLSSGDERAFILGDAIACPVQLSEVEWSGMGDMDPKLARQTQEAVAKEIEGSGALMGAAHFPELKFGRVLRGQGRRYWEPVG